MSAVPRGSSMKELVSSMFSLYADKPCFGLRRDSPAFAFKTYGEIEAECHSLGRYLSATIRNDPPIVFLYLTNCSEFYVADLACALYGLVSVPLYSTLSIENIRAIVAQSGGRDLLCTAEYASRFREALIGLEVKLNSITIVNPLGRVPHSVIDGMRDVCLHPPMAYHDALQSRESKTGELRDVTPKSIFTIMYTSGSTGVPKGAVITELAWRTRSIVRKPPPFPLRWLSFQPPAHLLDRRTVWAILMRGGCVGMCSPDRSKLFSDFQALNPTTIGATPGLWNELYSIYHQHLDELEREKPGSALEEREVEAMARVKQLLGSSVMMIRNIGAPVSDAVVLFLRKCFKCAVIDAYGSTETDSVINSGRVSKGAQVRLEDVPELGYTRGDLPHPRGEVCVKSDALFSGYYKDKDATSAAFTSTSSAKNFYATAISVHVMRRRDDGWFRTGDIGEMDERGRIKLIDRKKNVIKLAQGEFVTLDRLEAVYEQSPLFDAVYVYANRLWSFVTAVVVPSDQFFELLAPGKSSHLSTKEKHALCESAKARRIARKEASRIARGAKLQPYEYPRVVLLDAEPFTALNGLLTSTGKRRRMGLKEKFGPRLEAYVAEMTVSDAPGRDGSTEDAICAIFARGTGAIVLKDGSDDDDINELSLQALGCDSMSAARVMGLLKAKFGVELPVPFLLLESTTVKRLAGIVSAPASDRRRLVDELRDELFDKSALLADCELRPSLVPRRLDAVPDRRVVLLTGSSGFLGIHLLEYLLLETSHAVVCILRASSDDAATARLRNAAQSAHLNVTGWDRVHCIAGDLGKKRFNLSGAQWNQLANSITDIYHCGAFVNHVLPYSALRASNVGGTLSAIELCCEGNAKFLHFISSIGVVQTMRPSKSGGLVFREDGKLTERGLSKSNGYIQTKWVCEHLLRAAHERGLRCTISRPSFISGHSQSGHCNRDDSICRLLLSMKELQKAPDADLYFEMSPVDFVSLGLVRVCEYVASAPLHYPEVCVVHPVAPNNAISLRVFADAVSRSGAAVRMVPEEEWRTEVASTPNSFQALISTFASQKLFAQAIDSSVFNRLLLQGGVSGTAVDVTSEVLQRYLQFMEQESARARL